MPGKIAITGGTGFVGRSVVSDLLRNGYQVRCLVREGSLVEPQTGVTVIRGALTSPVALAKWLEGAEAVVHLAGIIREFRDSTFEQVHAAGTAAVVKAVQEAGIARLVHMSALGTRAGASSRYHITKWQAEESVRASSLKWTIFRPSLIYGKGDAFVTFFDRMADRSPLIPVMGGGSNRMQPLSVEDTVKAFTGALHLSASIGKTYTLCGPDVLTFREILREIVGKRGRRRWLVPVPMWMARVQAALLEFVYPVLLNKPSPLNREQLKMLMEDNVGDPRPAQEQFGLELPSFKEGLQRMFRDK